MSSSLRHHELQPARPPVPHHLRVLCAKLLQSCPTLWDPMDCSHQALLSMGFPRQEYYGGLLFPPPRDLPNPGIKPVSLVSPALAVQFFITEPPGKPKSHEQRSLAVFSPRGHKSQTQPIIEHTHIHNSSLIYPKSNLLSSIY